MSVSTSSEGEGDLENDDINGNGKVLRIPIPHFGIIKIEQGGISKMSFGAPGGAEEPASHPSASNNLGGYSGALVSMYGESSILDEQSQNAQAQTLGGLSNNAERDTQVFDEGMMLNEEDWGLQGVDMAFFESLMRGSMEPEGSGVDMWTIS
jgi:hypothetical protein